MLNRRQRQMCIRDSYQTFKLRKRTGGERTISAPMPRLKTAQRWILETLLNQVEVHEAAHGFCRGRSRDGINCLFISDLGLLRMGNRV